MDRDLLHIFAGMLVGVVLSITYYILEMRDDIAIEETKTLDDSVINVLTNDKINQLFPDFIFNLVKLYSNLNLFPQIIVMFSLLSFIGVITLLLEKILIKTKLNVIMVMVIVWITRIIVTSVVFFLLNQPIPS